MKLDNHIAYRLLTEKSLWMEMCTSQYENDKKTQSDEDILIGQAAGLHSLLNNERNRTYFVTKSVTDRLDMFDTKKCLGVDGWKIFAHLPDFKKTFILPDGNDCIRVQKLGGLIYFCHISFKLHKKENRTTGDDGELYWILLFVDLEKNRIAEHWLSEDGNRVAPFLFALMCFTELCDNQTIELQPKSKNGTKKSGKIINSLPFPLTIINNTWNVTTVRGEGFPVVGHAAIRWTGAGRSTPKLVFIEPFMKHGYTRKSGKELSSLINKQI